MSPRSLRLGIVVSAAVALAACGGTSEPGTPPAPTLATLAITAPLDTLTELSTRQLSVAATDTKGQPFANPTLTWTSSDTNVIQVSTSGSVTARQPGSATVTAASGSVRTSQPLRVVPAAVWSIGVRLVGGVASDTLLVGSSATLVGEPRDIGGRPLLGRTVSFTVVDTGRGSIAGGRLTGRTVGPLDVVAQVDTAVRRNTIVVRPTYAARLAVKLADPRRLVDTLWVGLRDSAVVTFADAAGQTVSSAFRSVKYETADDKIATVDFQGRVVPVAVGNTTLRVSGDSLTATVPLRIVAAPVLSIVASSDTVRVIPGESAVLRPILVDGAGLRVTTLGARALRFDALDPSVATVDAQGNVRGVSTGVARVRMTSERGTVVAPVRVVAPLSGTDAFNIKLRFIGPTPAPEVVEAFNAAKTRWENVIRASTGTYTDTLFKGDCGLPEETHEEQIRDVIILATIDSIDGPSNILGSAGPCYIKQLANGHWLPSIGRMRFDSADIRLMVTTGRIGNVIAHEMGHVLGIGTMWASRYHVGTAMANQGGSDPRYFGSGGILASAGMGFTGTVTGGTANQLENVPLENTGGSGTAGSHWRRSIFGNELMNGFAGAGLQPLSLLTVQGIADLGYTVSTSAAESWGQFLITPLTGVSASRGVLSTQPAIPLNEVLLSPVRATDRRGRTQRFAAPQ